MLLGAPRHLVRWLRCNASSCNRRRISGSSWGPMMGFTLPHAMVPVVKATNCLLSHPGRAAAARPRTGLHPLQRLCRCLFATLLPQELYWYSRVKEYDKGREAQPVRLASSAGPVPGSARRDPLVQYYKIAKDDIREARAEAEKAERPAALRGQKQARFERDKAAREARHAEAAAQRRQAMTAAGRRSCRRRPGPPKAKQETAQAGTSEPAPDNGAMIAAREARKQEALARRQRRLRPLDGVESGAVEVDPKGGHGCRPARASQKPPRLSVATP